MTASDLITDLSKKFSSNYVFPNIYYFAWESDLLIITRSGYVWEIEVKVSKSDYKADFNKRLPYFIEGNSYKHNILSNKKGNIPNRFYFAAPAGIIDTKTLPKYCGLIEYNVMHRIVKQAPILHRNDVINYKLLFERMYWRHHDLWADMVRNQYRLF